MDAKGYANRLQPLLVQAAAYARSLLRNRDDAQDAVQQAALRGWERIHQYDRARPFKGWWFAILRNCCFDTLRSKKALRSEAIEGFGSIPERACAAFDWQALDTALSKLSDTHREILRMKYFGDLKYDELAEALGIPIGTVMSRLHIARKALAALVQEEF
jgi:RNA polymerase sigma-70 factor (ECF subfamily)